MVTPDCQPWLLEINSSPSMARNTQVTCKMVDAVMEDMLKGKASSEHWSVRVRLSSQTPYTVSTTKVHDV